MMNHESPNMHSAHRKVWWRRDVFVGIMLPYKHALQSNVTQFSMFSLICYKRRSSELDIYRIVPAVFHPSYSLTSSLTSASLSFSPPSSLLFPFLSFFLAEEASLAEQVRRIKDIEAIESDSFVPQAFKSSRDATKVTEPVEIKKEAESVDTSMAKDSVVSLPIAIKYNDSDTLAHHSLFLDKEEAEKLWLNRLLSLRQERLMGSPVL
uniref:Arginine/serine-rich coiled-coil 1 n=1 Tax=Pygocentrus nattereri TaxID=42514 RepID=A0AAR2J1E9_PYGNA